LIGILEAIFIGELSVIFGNLPLVQKILFCRNFSFIRWVSAVNSQMGQAEVISDLMAALWEVKLVSVLNRSLCSEGLGSTISTYSLQQRVDSNGPTELEVKL
jgi:hypothetical protein